MEDGCGWNWLWPPERHFGAGVPRKHKGETPSGWVGRVISDRTSGGGMF